MEPDPVDKLLERYLSLLDEYTTLRSALEDLQGAMYQNIARANFSGERGVRYGRDFYDDRMQASRRVVLSEAGGVPEFSTAVKELDDEGCVDGGREEKDDGGEREGGDGEQDDGGEREEVAEESKGSGSDPSSEKGAGAESGSESSENEDEKEREKKRRERARDPLRWFGFITPMPLRLAQTQATQLVETVIPRLASVDAEMKDVEIEVRRARKRRAKAEAESAKASDGESLAAAAGVSA